MGGAGAPGIRGFGTPYATGLDFRPESLSLWLTAKLCSFAGIGIVKVRKGNLQLLTNNPFHPCGKLLLLACVDLTAKTELTVCWELESQGQPRMVP